MLKKAAVVDVAFCGENDIVLFSFQWSLLFFDFLNYAAFMTSGRPLRCHPLAQRLSAQRIQRAWLNFWTKSSGYGLMIWSIMIDSFESSFAIQKMLDEPNGIVLGLGISNKTVVVEVIRRCDSVSFCQKIFSESQMDQHQGVLMDQAQKCTLPNFSYRCTRKRHIPCFNYISLQFLYMFSISQPWTRVNERQTVIWRMIPRWT